MTGYFYLLGFVLLVAEIIATRYAFKAIKKSMIRRPWLYEFAAAVIGLGLAVGTFFIAYNISDTWRIIGFPFAASALEKTPTGWMDFVGPLTFPAMIGNAVIGLLLPQLPLAVILNRLARRDAQKPG
jgi:formate/nitrite transporter FocA (FNT family)